MANKLDQFFQKKLRNRKFTPIEGDWAAMENLLNSGSTPPSNSISLNWMYSGLIIVLVGIGIYVGFKQDLVSANDPKTNPNKIENAGKESKLPVKYESESFSNKNLKEEKINHDLLNNSLSKKEENRENKIIANNESLNHTNSQKVSESIDVSENIKQSQNTLLVQNSRKDIENQSSEKYAGNNSDYKKNNSDNQEEDEIVKLMPSSSSFSNGGREGNFNEDKKVAQYQTADISLSELTSAKKYTPKNTKDEFNNSESNYAHLYLISTPVETIEENQIQRSIISPLPDDDPQRIKALKSKRSLPIQLSVAAFGEVSYISKKIKGDNEFSYLSSIRNAQEKNIVSGGLGIELQASYKNIGLSSGISLIQSGENIQYEEKYTSDWEVSTSEMSDTLWTQEIIFTFDTIVNPVDSSTYIVIIDSSFVTVIDSIFFVTVYDSTLVDTEVGLAKQNGRTTIQYWEIPLYFSYKFDIGDFYLNPGIGVTFGFLKITKGYYMGEDLMSLIPINTQYAVFKKTLVNGLINFGVGYRLGDRFSIEATPSYRFNLTNILENPGMIQRYSSISLQFRLRYYF